MSGKGTPATQVVSAAGVTYALHSYDHDPGVASYGLEAADRMGVSPKRVAKTLVASVTRSTRPELIVGVVPVDRLVAPAERMPLPRTVPGRMVALVLPPCTVMAPTVPVPPSVALPMLTALAD